MGREWNLFLFQLKKMKLSILISILYLYPILVSVQLGILQQSEEMGEQKTIFFGSAQKYLPFLGVLWGIVLNRMYFDENTAEVIYTSDHFPKIRFHFYAYLLLQMIALPMYLWFYRLYQDEWEILRLVLQMAVLQFGLFFWASVLRSGVLAAGITVCGTMLMQYVGNSAAWWNYFQVYVLARNVTVGQQFFLWMSMTMYIVGSIVLERIRFQ